MERHTDAPAREVTHAACQRRLCPRPPALDAGSHRNQPHAPPPPVTVTPGRQGDHAAYPSGDEAGVSDLKTAGSSPGRRATLDTEHFLWFGLTSAVPDRAVLLHTAARGFRQLGAGAWGMDSPPRALPSTSITVAIYVYLLTQSAAAFMAPASVLRSGYEVLWGS